jgi:hypothetical protein
VLKVRDEPQFSRLLPHLRILAEGAIHLTEPPPAYADGYNKLIEVYWASICLSAGLEVEIDDPQSSNGRNPDIITKAPSRSAKHGYAFKTIRSPHTQSILEHIEKGRDQIETSSSSEGVVALHLTPRLQTENIWPQGGFYSDWRQPALDVSSACRAMLAQVVTDNGQPRIDDIFRGTKVAGSILCVGFCPTVAAHPVTGLPTVMPLKVATLVQVCLGSLSSPDESYRFDNEVRKARAVRPELKVPIPCVLRRSEVRKPNVFIAVEPFEVATGKYHHAISVHTDLIVDASAAIDVEAMLPPVLDDLGNLRRTRSPRNELHPAAVLPLVQ